MLLIWFDIHVNIHTCCKTRKIDLSMVKFAKLLVPVQFILTPISILQCRQFSK